MFQRMLKTNTVTRFLSKKYSMAPKKSKNKGVKDSTANVASKTPSVSKFSNACCMNKSPLVLKPNKPTVNKFKINTKLLLFLICQITAPVKVNSTSIIII